MPKPFQCPFCNSFFPLTKDTFKVEEVESGIFKEENFTKEFGYHYEYLDKCDIYFYCCPNCEKASIELKGVGSQVKDLNVNIMPNHHANSYPDYIPIGIKQDYEEACKIVTLSPKASATLSRRCLQGMIRDYWSISGKKNLYQEIEAIKNNVTHQEKEVLDSVRKIGNIGAHMEKDINLIVDIDPDEAQQLINLIEYLMDQWYIKRYESELMLDSIISINNSKQEQRKS